jgi:phosphate transport system permease protein
MQKRIAARYSAERRFRTLGLTAIVMSAGFLAYLLISMLHDGLAGFTRTEIAMRIDFPTAPIVLDPASLRRAPTPMPRSPRSFPGRASPIRRRRRTSARTASGSRASAWVAVRDAVKHDPSVLQKVATLNLPASAELDLAAKSDGSDEAEAAYARLDKTGLVHRAVNWSFLTASDGTDPTQVGIWGAFKGSLLTMFGDAAAGFPIGVLAALYLEEYAPRNRWTDLIEVSINNLAAVPSIIFGLLGPGGVPQHLAPAAFGPLVGGLTLALMTMPVIVIAGRNAIKAVPPSIRDAALGIGASPGAGGVPPCAAARPPRHPDRHHHRHGARAGRDRAAADDRHARLRRQPARRA